MRPAWLVAVAVWACSPRPRPAPPAPVPVIEAAVAEQPSRRGQCELDAGIADFLEGQTPRRCADRLRRADASGPDAIRACMVGAVKDRAAFLATFTLGGYDSRIEQAFAGRATGAGYEVRRFTYDSCPSGCGDADPVRWMHSCTPFEDLGAACASAARRKADEDLGHACEDLAEGAPGFPSPGGERRLLVWLGVWCGESRVIEGCPGGPR